MAEARPGAGRAITLAAGCSIALVLASSTAATSHAPVSRNGLLAFTGMWEAVRFDQVFSVDVATGIQRSLTPVETLAGSLAAVSPDGATILFQRRSIWRMDADGSGKRELAPGSEPAWSRDGKRIAYVDPTGYVSTMNAEGGDRERLGRGTLPVWSPDGRRIAYVERGSPLRVMVVGADGSRPRSLFSTTDTFLSVLWSPDGRNVAVAADDLIVLLPVVGGAQRVLARDVAGLTGLQWSPDGSTFAFERSGRLWTVTASGVGMVALTDPLRPSAPSTVQSDASPQWSPDGRSLAFIRTVTSSRRGLIGDAIWTVPASGGAPRQVTNPTGEPTFGTKVAWSGDGRELVYSRAVMYGGGVGTIRPDGTKLSRLKRGARYPAFSPDGRSIAFIASGNPSAPDSGDLFVMRTDGSDLRQLTRSVDGERTPAWSADGSRIVFTRYVPGRDPLTLAIYTVRPNGSGLRRIRAATAVNAEPAWSPDGRTIAAIRDGDLITMNANGSDPRRIPGLTGQGHTASAPAWSPHGDRISFIRRCPLPTCVELDEGSLWTVGARGESPRKLVENAYHAAWSPDGTRLAVIVGTSRTIRIFSARGRPLRHLRFEADYDQADRVSWQPGCTLLGGPRADRLEGTARSELICGLGEADRITGGRGRDRLFGGDGNDAIDARDGTFDVVGCGPGVDSVHADRSDYVGVDCERVTRR